jgi:hypothetical protein
LGSLVGGEHGCLLVGDKCSLIILHKRAGYSGESILEASPHHVYLEYNQTCFCLNPDIKQMWGSKNSDLIPHQIRHPGNKPGPSKLINHDSCYALERASLAILFWRDIFYLQVRVIIYISLLTPLYPGLAKISFPQWMYRFHWSAE